MTPTPVTVLEWATIGKAIVYIGGICTAFFSVLKFWQWYRSHTTIGKLEQSMITLSATVAKHERYIANDDLRIKGIEAKIEESKVDREQMHKAYRVMLVAVQALLKSNLEGGNNKAGMQRASEAIQDFLNSNI